MVIKIEKESHKYDTNRTGYTIEIRSYKPLTKGEYQTIIDSIKNISDVLTPIIKIESMNFKQK